MDSLGMARRNGQDSNCSTPPPWGQVLQFAIAFEAMMDSLGMARGSSRFPGHIECSALPPWGQLPTFVITKETIVDSPGMPRDH